MLWLIHVIRISLLGIQLTVNMRAAIDNDFEFARALVIDGMRESY